MFSIPSNAGAQEHVAEVHGEESYRTIVLKWLHQKWVQLTLMCLLLFDIIIIFTELFLMSAFPACSIIVRDCIACCGGEEQGHDRRWLAEDHEEELCPAGYHETGEASCDGHKWHGVHTLEEVLFFTTVAILSIFFAEIMIEVWALTPCVYFRQVFYALDFFIITVSLALELFFHFVHNILIEELVGLGVIFRLWRFVRIGHGIVEITSELTHEHYEKLIEYANECTHELESHHIEVPATTKEVKKMMNDVSEMEDLHI
jgi:hypothetical protein